MLTVHIIRGCKDVHKVRILEEILNTNAGKKMKKLFSLLLGVVFCTALPCEAKSQAKLDGGIRKMYVNPKAIKVTKDGIFLLKNGALFPVESVCKDKDGVFVKVKKRDMTECQTCHKMYDANRYHHCPHCGHL